MGIYYRSYAILGVRFKLNGPRFETVEKTHSCDHPERTGKTYCPTCGTKVREREVFSKTELAEEFRDKVEEGKMPPGFICVTPSDYFGYHHIGFGITSSREDETNRTTNLHDIDTIRQQIKAILEPWGIFDQEVMDSFGLYSLTLGR
jgi:hypothetical protein